MRKMRCICSSGKQTGCGRNDRAGPPRRDEECPPFLSLPRRETPGLARVHTRARVSTIAGARRNHATRFCTRRHVVYMKFAVGSQVTRDWIFHRRGIESRIPLGWQSSSFCVTRNIKYLCDIYSNNCERTLPPCPLRRSRQERREEEGEET